LLGISIFTWLAPWQGAGSREREARGVELRARSNEHRSQSRSFQSPASNLPLRFGGVARLSAITACILLTVSLFVAGSGGREQIDLRLTETMEQRDLGLGARVDVILKDVPKMIMDFPLFGVGLGAWTELFLRYRSGPWSTVFFREAHNDYLEVLAETGLIGFGLLTVFFFVAGKRLVRGLRKSSSRYLPLIAGILSALGGMALHEWLDFNLQIPAIAFLFTVLLAIGLRFARQARDQRPEIRDQLAAVGDHRFAIRNPESAITAEWAEVRDQRSDVRDQRSASKLSRFPAFQPAMGVAAAVGMIVFAVTQDQPPYVGAVADVGMIVFAQNQSSYPHNFTEMSSLVEAKELLLKHPTHSPYHMSVLRLAGGGAPLEWQLTQAKAALWNEPVNPYYRDFYAATLMAMGKNGDGLKEVARSVAESPSLSTHVYLNPENLPLLSEAEQAAVEEGFQQALSRSYPEALNGLADFYAKLERFSDQGALYEQAALKESDKQSKITLLMNAGGAYLKAAASSEQRTAREGQSAKGTEQSAAVTRHQSAVAKRNNATVRDVRDEGVGVRRDVGSKEQSAKGEAKNAERSRAINAINATNGERFRAAAERVFRDAIAAKPTDAEPYQQLVTSIFAMSRTLDDAKDVVLNGIKSGAPPLPLYLSLAEAAHKGASPDDSKAALTLAKSEVDELIKNGENPYTLYIAFADGARSAGDREEETIALLKALELQPRSPDVLSRLANVYFEKQNFDRAALYLNRVAKITPDSPDLQYRLAVAEEARYRFADAGRAYARAIELAPKNDGYRARYEEFKLRVQRNREVTINKTQ
jgi:tetratricopeptide (TPR) repeat protein